MDTGVSGVAVDSDEGCCVVCATSGIVVCDSVCFVNDASIDFEIVFATAAFFCGSDFMDSLVEISLEFCVVVIIDDSSAKVGIFSTCVEISGDSDVTDVVMSVDSVTAGVMCIVSANSCIVEISFKTLPYSDVTSDEVCVAATVIEIVIESVVGVVVGVSVYVLCTVVVDVSVEIVGFVSVDVSVDSEVIGDKDVSVDSSNV